MATRRYSKTQRKAYREAKRYQKGGLDYAANQAYEKYVDLSTKALENGKVMHEEFTKKQLKQFIESEVYAGSSLQEASRLAADEAFSSSFNDYSRTGDYDVQVLSKKQAEVWLNKLKRAGENVKGITEEDIRTGKFDTKAYWAKLTAGLSSTEVFLLGQFFFGS